LKNIEFSGQLKIVKPNQSYYFLGKESIEQKIREIFGGKFELRQKGPSESGDVSQHFSSHQICFSAQTQKPF